jgi:phosphoglycolate phosphatase-like HAD superfamily hydrolase
MGPLVVFDIDGTLTASMEVDSMCFAEAVAEHFSLAEVDTRWERYTSSTDAGLLREIVNAHGLSLSAADASAVENRFVEKLEAVLDRDRSLCPQIAGAGDLISALSERSSLRLALATGGWARSARLKLATAGLSCDGLPFASSNDSDRRETIISTAIDRAGGHGGRLRNVTYVGDGIWDVRAARNLGCRFIGIANSPAKELALKSAGASVVIRDHTEIDRFVELVSATSSS